MTAEQIHDALTLLPTDLIAEADHKRTQKPRVIQWKRYAAMAACFALVLGVSLLGIRMAFSGKETAAAAPAEAAVMQGSGLREETAEEAPAAAEETLCALPTAALDEQPAEPENGLAESAGGSSSVKSDNGSFSVRYVQTPREEDTTASFTSTPRIRRMYSRADLDAYLEYYDWQYDFAALAPACDSFDEAWFGSHDLLLLAVHSVPAEEGCKVNSIQETGEGWAICLGTPLRLEEDISWRTDWHILIETEKGLIPEEATVTLIYE